MDVDCEIGVLKMSEFVTRLETEKTSGAHEIPAVDKI